MTSLTIDEATLSVLQQAQRQVELRDVRGNVVGFFIPASSNLRYPTTPVSEADLAEIDRRRATEGQGPGKTTREIFERLKTLTDDPAEQADLQRHIDELTERDRCASSGVGCRRPRMS